MASDASTVAMIRINSLEILQRAPDWNATVTRPETNRNFHLSLCISFSLLDTVNPYHTTWGIGHIYVRAARALYMFIYIPESFPFRIYRFPPYLIRPWGEEAVALCLCRIIISSY